MTRARPTRGFMYRLEWQRKTPPPDGVKVLGTAFATHTGPDNEAKHLHDRLREIGYGRGYAISVSFVEPPAQRRSKAARGQQRRRNLERRVTGKRGVGPLFARDVIAQEVQRRPEYFAGKADPAHEARIRELDQQDAQQWATYLAWWDAQQPKVTPFWQ